jgi:hypothetical protein
MEGVLSRACSGGHGTAHSSLGESFRENFDLMTPPSKATEFSKVGRGKSIDEGP